MSRPRFSIRKSKGRLLGRDESDWSSYASFYAPAFPDVMEVISLGDRYVASLGAPLCQRSCPVPVASMAGWGRELAGGA